MSHLTSHQKRQLNWLDKMELREIGESVGTVRTFFVSCRDCNVGQEFHVSNNVARFIEQEHPGHRTWIDYAGKTNGMNYLRH